MTRKKKKDGITLKRFYFRAFSFAAPSLPHMELFRQSRQSENQRLQILRGSFKRGRHWERRNSFEIETRRTLSRISVAKTKVDGNEKD